jgi:hypothetical protein
MKGSGQTRPLGGRLKGANIMLPDYPSFSAISSRPAFLIESIVKSKPQRVTDDYFVRK